MNASNEYNLDDEEEKVHSDLAFDNMPPGRQNIFGTDNFTEATILKGSVGKY